MANVMDSSLAQLRGFRAKHSMHLSLIFHCQFPSQIVGNQYFNKATLINFELYFSALIHFKLEFSEATVQ